MLTPGQPSGPALEIATAIPLTDAHPVVIAQTPTIAGPPYKIELPPMVYSSAMPTPPNVPTEETAALIREVHDQADWEFTGRVEAPDFARAMSRALGESGATNDSDSGKSANDAGDQKKSGGFWAALKHLFIGYIRASAGKSNCESPCTFPRNSGRRHPAAAPSRQSDMYRRCRSSCSG